MTNNRLDIPNSWLIASDYDPKQHMMNLKGKDYLNVQHRLLWFIRDQRDFIARGLWECTYVVRTELVEQDLERGFAHFKTYVRDVLGNEATMYGSETAKDFGDYAEKASTKSLGRALWALGYGTGMAPEMDESEERPVDSPIARTGKLNSANAPIRSPEGAGVVVTPEKRRMATPEQWNALRTLCARVHAEEPEPGSLTFEHAGALIAEYSETYKRLVAQQQRQNVGANGATR